MREQISTHPNHENYKTYTLEYLLQHQSQDTAERKPGSIEVYHDELMEKWRMRIQLEEKRIWFLSVFIKDDHTFDMFCLDRETAADSHYEFKAEAEVRKDLYQKGDEDKLLHEILIAFFKNHSGGQLLEVLEPYITAYCYFD